MLKIVTTEVEFNITPLETISMGVLNIMVDFDDKNEKRWRTIFQPYQAVKITTIDCIYTNQLLIDSKRPMFLLEMQGSEWIEELKKVLKCNDNSATFLEKSHHYLFPFQDIILEIVAWENFKLERLT